MTDIPERIQWRREWSLTDPYDVTTVITLPEQGIKDDIPVIMLARGAFLHVESKAMTTTRQEMADALGAVVVESSFYLSEIVNTPSPKHTYNLHPRVMSELADKNLPGDMTFKQLLEACALHSISPTLLFTPTQAPKGVEYMFFLAAMDVLKGLILALDLLDLNNIQVDRVMASGVSGGANLVHICNLLWPGSFSLIVDDSSIAGVTYVMQPWKNSIELNGIKATFIQDFSLWLETVDPDLLSPVALYEINGNEIPPSPMVFYASVNDKFVATREKDAFCEEHPHCRAFLANRENHYLDGIFNSGGHADSDRIKAVKSALEYASPPGSHAWMKPPNPLKIKTQKHLYMVDNPFSPDESVAITERKGEE